MGFRFRRSIKIAPGIRLNVSKSGISATIGTRGATVNIGKRGTRTTVGIPGSGISYSELSKPASKPVDAEGDGPEGSKNLLMGIGFIAALILVAWVIDKL
jgi:hypothetical protein